jgi:hypothetical protein
MAITPEILLPQIKRHLKNTGTADDAEIIYWIATAVEYLQKFKSKTLVDVVTDANTQVALTFNDKSLIRSFVQKEIHGIDLSQDIANKIEQVREGK